MHQVSILQLELREKLVTRQNNLKKKAVLYTEAPIITFLMATTETVLITTQQHKGGPCKGQG